MSTKLKYEWPFMVKLTHLHFHFQGLATCFIKGIQWIYVKEYVEGRRGTQFAVDNEQSSSRYYLLFLILALEYICGLLNSQRGK